jgi:hypothetical protein
MALRKKIEFGLAALGFVSIMAFLLYEEKSDAPSKDEMRQYRASLMGETSVQKITADARAEAERLRATGSPARSAEELIEDAILGECRNARTRAEARRSRCSP